MLPEIDLDIPEHGGKKERDIVVAIEHVRVIPAGYRCDLSLPSPYAICSEIYGLKG